MIEIDDGEPNLANGTYIMVLSAQGDHHDSNQDDNALIFIYLDDTIPGRSTLSRKPEKTSGETLSRLRPLRSFQDS